MSKRVFNLILFSFILYGCAGNITLPLVGDNGHHSDKVRVHIKAKKYELDNGLRVLIFENHKLPIYSYYTFFDVGGRYESKGLIGGTHYLEHMMFKGAKKFGPGVFDDTIEGNGGSNNAYTSRDLTVYHEHMPSGTINQIIDLEADRLQNLLLEPKSFEVERKVILDERLRNYDTNPRSLLFLETMKAVFAKTPYGRSVIGTNKEIKALKRDDVLKYFKDNYAPNNAVIIVAGDVDGDDVIQKIKEVYGPILPSKALKKYKARQDDDKLYRHQGKYKRSIKLHGINPNPIYILAYKGDPSGTRKGYTMDILASVIGDGQSSYLNKKYVLGRRPSLVSIGAGNYTLKKNGIFYIMGQLLPKMSLKKHKRNLLKNIKKFCNDKKIDFDRNIKKIKNQYLVNVIDQLKTNKGVADFLGRMEIFFSDYEYYKKELEIYESITSDEVKNVCNEVFGKDEYIFLSIWNKNKK